MDDGATALRDRPGYPAPGIRQRRGWSRRPHHRRRRATAALVAAAIVMGAAGGLMASAGSGPRHVQRSGSEFFAQVRALAGSGPGSFTRTESQAENAAIDRTLAYTPYVRIAGSQHRELALTFDDGPGPYTPEILSTLERLNVPATFFEVGILEQYFHASTSAIVARGYTVGDHTFSHAPMSFLSPSDQRAQLLEAARAFERYGAPFPRLFRPPFGMWNSHTLALLRRYRMLMVLWTVDTSDYRRPGVPAIVSSVLAHAKPGAIILLHDAGGNRSETVAALPKLIAKLRARGYRFVTVPKLLLDNPPPHDQQISSVIGTGG